MVRNVRKRTFGNEPLAKIQISMRIRSLIRIFTWRRILNKEAGMENFLMQTTKSDEISRMHKLIPRL